MMDRIFDVRRIRPAADRQVASPRAGRWLLASGRWLGSVARRAAGGIAIASLGLALNSVAAAADSQPPAGEQAPADKQAPAASSELVSRWEFFQQTAGEPPQDARLAELVLTPSVFSEARLDLADLRLYDAQEREVPYALRVRRPEDATVVVPTSPFNRTGAPDRSSQLSLDLQQTQVEHNEVQVELLGVNFRRRALLEGSDRGETWSKMAEQDLLRFHVADDKLVDLTVRYSPSRFRYLRLTVWPDPQVDEDKPVAIGKVVVRRRVKVPGEFTIREAPFGDRDPVRADGGPGSAWIIDLGGTDVPCSHLHVHVSDAEFVRDWRLEAAGPAGSKDEDFRWIARGTWRRRAGEKIQPMVAEFSEVTAARLRLVVTDHRNPPLQIERCNVLAAARVVVFPVAELAPGPAQLYYGNPDAEAPNYDFSRNLPPRLEPPPARLGMGPRTVNPIFQPEPLPLTERWPWLIYVLLSFAVAVLGLLILNLARTAIHLDDSRQAQTA